MISSTTVSDLGRYPEVEAVYNPDEPHRMTICRYGGVIVKGPEDYTRLAEAETVDLGLGTVN